MFIPKTQEIKDSILIEKAVQSIHRIIKNDPRERAMLLKGLKKNPNIEYKGDYKALDTWLDRLEHDLDEEISDKIGEEQCKHEYEEEQ